MEYCIDLESPKLNIHTAVLIASFSSHFVHAQSANHSCRQTQSLWVYVDVSKIVDYMFLPCGYEQEGQNCVFGVVYITVKFTFFLQEVG